MLVPFVVFSGSSIIITSRGMRVVVAAHQSCICVSKTRVRGGGYLVTGGWVGGRVARAS